MAPSDDKTDKPFLAHVYLYPGDALPHCTMGGPNADTPFIHFDGDLETCSMSLAAHPDPIRYVATLRDSLDDLIDAMGWICPDPECGAVFRKHPRDVDTYQRQVVEHIDAHERGEKPSAVNHASNVRAIR